MTLDEYETIRLIDLEGLTQEQCADRMEVARTTAQSIYAAARKKLAQCLVDSRPLKIGGGDIALCERRTRTCGPGCGCTCRSESRETADNNRDGPYARGL